MFRKKIAVTIAAALMTLSASSAFAAFADLELIRVYYDRNGAESATDLGKVTDFTAAGAVNNIAGSFDGLTTGFAVYFALDRNTSANDLWATGAVGTPSTINGGGLGLNGIKNGTTPMYSEYNTQGGTEYTGLASGSSSYKTKLSSTQGTLAAAISTASRLNTEVSIASLIGASSGSVTQALYFWDKATSSLAADKIGVLAATITTNFDGSTIITSSTPAAPTPIPPAFLLMGSGLLGMVGLRRKSKTA